MAQDSPMNRGPRPDHPLGTPGSAALGQSNPDPRPTAAIPRSQTNPTPLRPPAHFHKPTRPPGFTNEPNDARRPAFTNEPNPPQTSTPQHLPTRISAPRFAARHRPTVSRRRLRRPRSARPPPPRSVPRVRRFQNLRGPGDRDAGTSRLYRLPLDPCHRGHSFAFMPLGNKRRPGDRLPSAKKRPGLPRGGRPGRFWVEDPAITDFRADRTIIGPAGLTAVFGMGTGVAPPVWSPGNRPRDAERPHGRGYQPGCIKIRNSDTSVSRQGGRSWRVFCCFTPDELLSAEETWFV